MEDKRKNQCSCGSKIFYGKMIGEEWYICCVGINCNNKWFAKREGDRLIPSFDELRKVWE